ncbi:MAG: amidohydrolase family protein [Gammaproteobacteria bacterium]|nr:amidohydrolase family protein [Gammaproteobacteria bacterium]
MNPSPLPDRKIVDLHAHTAGIGAGGSGCFLSPELRNSFKFGIYLKAFAVTEEELEVNGDAIVFKRISNRLSSSKHVEAAIVLAMDGVVDSTGELSRSETQVYVPNDFVRQETEKYPNLFFGASINPYRKDAVQQLERVVRQDAKLIKWIPSIQLIDPSDQNIIPFYEKLRELGLPLLIHTGQERSFVTARDEYADPVRLRLPLSLGVTVIAAHVATTGETDDEEHFDRLLPMFAEYSNLYGDISSITQLNKLKYMDIILKNRDIHGQLLYGSDMPLISTILVSPFYYPLNLTLSQMFSIASVDNVWDRDVMTKQALGIPANIFSRTGELLEIPPAPIP